MIPKKIHYCWLSGEEMPELMRNCMTTWNEVLPDYELVKWDGERFDLDSIPYVREAVKARKWAFAADYIRLHAVHSEGGIYLDTDVVVRKPLDDLLGHAAFSAVEYHKEFVRKKNTEALLNPDGSSITPMTRKPGIGIQAAILGGVKGHPFFADCLAFYKDRHFVIDEVGHANEIIAPDLYAMVAESYGFRYQNRTQSLREDFQVLESELLAGNMDQATEASYAVHLCSGSWREASAKDWLSGVRKVVKKAIGR